MAKSKAKPNSIQFNSIQLDSIRIDLISYRTQWTLFTVHNCTLYTSLAPIRADLHICTFTPTTRKFHLAKIVAKQQVRIRFRLRGEYLPHIGHHTRTFVFLLSVVAQLLYEKKRKKKKNNHKFTAEIYNSSSFDGLLAIWNSVHFHDAVAYS